MKPEDLPPGSVVASRDEAWIKEDEDRVELIFCMEGWIDRPWTGAFSQMTDSEMDELLESNGAVVLRVGDGTQKGESS